MSVETWLNVSAPLNSQGDFDKCVIFDLDYAKTFERPSEKTATRPCQAWEYKVEYFDVTIKLP